VPHSTPRHPHLVPCKNTNNHPLSLLSRTSTASHPSQNSDKKRLHAVYRPAPHTRRTTLSHLCRPSLHPQHRPKASTQPVTSLQAPVLHSSPVARHPSRGVRRFLQPRGATNYMDLVSISSTLTHLMHPVVRRPTFVRRHHPASRRIECPADVGVLRLHADLGFESPLHVTV
jgi:hypothetical protein